GGIEAERALNYGFTGPNLRATGIDYDIRTLTPYSGYQDFDFQFLSVLQAMYRQIFGTECRNLGKRQYHYPGR
ncbi:NADH-quinone oxidoreductase subunit D 2, partial [Filimonas sp.]